MSTLGFTKNVCEKYPRWTSLIEEIRRLDLINSTQPEQVCDKCKTTAETILKSILNYSGTFSEVDADKLEMPKLISEVLTILVALPHEEKVLRSQLTFLSEVRNSHGTAGHGRGLATQAKIREEVDESLNERIIRMADSTFAALIGIFEQKFPMSKSPVSYEENEEFNVYYDEANGGPVILGDFELILRASEVLYKCDPIAYQLAANEFRSNTEN
jgi:hypothetical protein